MQSKPSATARPRYSGLRRDLVLDMPFLLKGCTYNFAPLSIPHQSEHDLNWASSQLGPACDFSHADAYIHTDVGKNISYPCSIELVITPRDFDNDEVIFSWTNIGSLSTQPDCSIIIENSPAQMHFSPNATYRQGFLTSYLTLNQPNHILAVYQYSPSGTDDDCVLIYVNGIERSFKSGNYWGSSEDPEFVIGGRNDGQYPYSGLLDSIKVWNRGLAPEEAMRQYNDPWADYREELALTYHGAIHGGAAVFNPFWAVGSNQVL